MLKSQYTIVHEEKCNTCGNIEKADPVDISDPDGEDKWGAM